MVERLSGADFDGDTVMVIPTGGKVKITSTNKLRDFAGLDSKDRYGCDNKVVDKNGVTHYYCNGKEYRIMNNTRKEMGKVSNLIADMILRGATTKEPAQAVAHSMVVIDAEKHKLDYKPRYSFKKIYRGETDYD